MPLQIISLVSLMVADDLLVRSTYLRRHNLLPAKFIRFLQAGDGKALAQLQRNCGVISTHCQKCDNGPLNA
jgi:hypothetical protein